MDLTVRCHSCAGAWEITVSAPRWEDRTWTDEYELHADEHPACPECGRVHQPGEVLEVLEAVEA